MDNSIDVRQNWLNDITAHSKYRLRCYDIERNQHPTLAELDEISGWNSHLIKSVQKTADELHLSSGFFLVGEKGNGKRTATTATAIYLSENDGWFAEYGDDTDVSGGAFDVLFVGANDFISIDMPPIDCIDHIFDCYLNDDESGCGLCFVLERPEDIPEYEKFLSELGYLIISYRNRAETNPLVFFLISDTLDVKEIPTILRSQMRVCKLLPPNEKRRTEFWSCAAENEPAVRYMMGKRSSEEMARLTDKMTYRTLSDLVMLICDTAESDNEDIAEEQLEYERRICNPTPEKSDEREILYKKLCGLIDEIPNIAERFAGAIENITVPTGNVAPYRENAKSEETKSSVLEALGEDAKYLRDGIGEEDITSPDLFDREKYMRALENRPICNLVPQGLEF